MKRIHLSEFEEPHLIEEVQGDLQEEFDFQVRKIGAAKARLDYIRNVFEFIRL